MNYVFLGLSITSAWGNGHATTYRSLLRELATRRHQVTFLERDVPWYRDNRDLSELPGVEIVLYHDVEELERLHTARVRNADVVVVGSYVPDGIRVCEWVLKSGSGVRAFYDIDTPITVHGLEHDGVSYLRRDLVPEFDLYLSFTGGPILERIEAELGAQAARALYCSVDPQRYFPEQEEPRWSLGYLGTYSADRQLMLTELLFRPARELPEQQFVVAGAQYPTDLPWPGNVERITHVPPPRHRHFYSAQRFTLNVTRAEMIRAGYSPSVRLFEAAASGTPIITDYWAGLEELLTPGEEVLVAVSAMDVLSYLHDWTESDRLELAERARARILSAHTAAHRAAELEEYVLEAQCSRPTVPYAAARAKVMSDG